MVKPQAKLGVDVDNMCMKSFCTFSILCYFVVALFSALYFLLFLFFEFVQSDSVRYFPIVNRASVAPSLK